MYILQSLQGIYIYFLNSFSDVAFFIALDQKRNYVFVVTRLPLIQSTNPKLFFARICKKL